MCDPVTVLTTAVTATGTLQAGAAQARSHSANAAMLSTQAANREQKAKFDVERADKDFSRFSGTITANIAASGFDAASFSDVRNDDAAEHALQVAAIKWSAKNDVDNLKAQAVNESSKASSAKTGAVLGALGNIAGGFGTYQNNQARGIRINTYSPYAEGGNRPGS